MKEKIHPKYNKVVVRCGCGNTFETRSTADEIHAETCSMCHPFYTGKQRFMDTAGRIERFQKKYGNIVHEEGAKKDSSSCAAGFVDELLLPEIVGQGLFLCRERFDASIRRAAVVLMRMSVCAR